jgi:Flp pilus assembly secretin CpaC
MRCHLALALVALVVCPQWARGDEPAPTVAKMPSELHGPQLPAVADESREVVRLASAVELSSGAVSDQALLEEKLEELERLQAEVDRLCAATRTPQQILVKVEVIEVSLTKLRSLGTDFARATPEGFQKANLAELMTAGQSGFSLSAGATADFLGFLKQNNVAKALSDPSLVVTSGRPASILVGGQFPVPAAPGAASSVEFREFGTRVDVLATSLGNDRVRLEIHPRITEIDESRTIEIQGVRVPAFRVRQCNTAYEANFEETVILGGGSTMRVESLRHADGRVEERQNEIATWYVVRAEHIEPMDPSRR